MVYHDAIGGSCCPVAALARWIANLHGMQPTTSLSTVCLPVQIGGLRVCSTLKALLCSGNDELPQHWSVLRATHTLNIPKNYIRLPGGLSPIHLTHWRGVQGLMWGTRGPYLLAATMVGYSCVGQCWLLETYIRSTYCRNSKNCLRKYIFLFLHRSHTFLTSDLAAK